MLSIVVPSIGRIDCLTALLADLAKFNEAMECLIILQEKLSIADTEEFIGDFHQPLRIFYLSCPNASLARNIGLFEARGDIVLFLDDDVRIQDPNFLAAHLRNFEDASISGVYGQVLEVGQTPVSQPDPSEIETDWGWSLLPPNYARRCRTRNGASNNLAVRRDHAIAIGGMDAWFERGALREETEFNLRYTRAYGPLVFDPEATLIHLSASSGGSRSWGHVRKTVPMHHIVGHWYFFLRAMRDKTLGAKGMQRELLHIAIALLKNPQTGWNLLAGATNVFRALAGLCIATTRLIKGPKRLDRLDRSVYRKLDLSGPNS
jgi:glycosyltransferase involved in cell wall biosynthesis